ncbi:MAG: hypothetical protein ACLFWG_00375 [Longimicrobiales bacterium]
MAGLKPGPHRNTGGPHRLVSGRRVGQGKVAHLTREEIDGLAFPEKFEPVWGGAPAPSGPSGEGSDGGGEDGPDLPDVTQYHKGGGYYDIPGVGQVRGREAALEALLAGSEPETDARGETDGGGEGEGREHASEGGDEPGED